MVEGVTILFARKARRDNKNSYSGFYVSRLADSLYQAAINTKEACEYEPTLSTNSKKPLTEKKKEARKATDDKLKNDMGTVLHKLTTLAYDDYAIYSKLINDPIEDVFAYTILNGVYKIWKERNDERLREEYKHK